jgi:DNA-binding winged helix-turn-helix (wHTH) protein
VLQTIVDNDRQIDRIMLAHEAEFTLGGLRISPPKREVVAGAAREVLQPRIMQVLVVLARRRGQVVSRDELIRTCWDGYAVSDDAIHRCIGRIRRLSEAHGGFCLETVPRVGYQLTEAPVAPEPVALWRARPPLQLVLTLAAAAVLLFAAGFFGGHLL